MPLPRLVSTLLTLLFLTACTSELDPEIQKTALGDFSLDRLVVVMDDEPQSGFHSRKVSNDVLKAAVIEAVEPRLSRFDGSSSYSIGIKVQGYVLAHPGVPILLAPRSTLFLSVNVYDDVPRRLNAEPKNLTVWEDAGGDTVVGSGYTQSAEEQLAELSANAAIEIERWLRENPQWFRPKDAVAEVDAASGEGAAPASAPVTASGA